MIRILLLVTDRRRRAIMPRNETNEIIRMFEVPELWKVPRPDYSVRE